MGNCDNCDSALIEQINDHEGKMPQEAPARSMKILGPNQRTEFDC